MKKILIPVAGFFLFLFTACIGDNEDNASALADSLYNDVIKGHDEAMVRWMRIE